VAISTLLQDHRILTLDEVMNGLDVKSVRTLRELLRFRSGERSIPFSTHTMPSAEMLCNRVGVIHEGRIVAEGKVELKELARVKDLEEVLLRLTRGEEYRKSFRH
jgi:ABC-type multidrug transport system ATPase subunit